MGRILGCVLALVGACIVISGMRGLDPRRAELEEVGGRRVYSRLQDMNQRLEGENHRLHALLQEDESANMHVEAGLQAEAEKERARRRTIQQQEEALLGKLGGLGSEPMARSDGGGSLDGSVEALLDSTKQSAEAELSRDGGADEAGEAALAAESRSLPSLVSAHTHGDDDAGSSRRRALEREGERRRRLVSEERRAYHHDMRKAEALLQDDHGHRAMTAADDALHHYRKEARLQGFEGKAVRSKPEAWKLLRKTIQDEIVDYDQAQKVESSLADVVALRSSELSAKHKYQEEKRMLKHTLGGHGQVGDLVTVTDRSGGLDAEEHGIRRLQRHLEHRDRAWERASALEKANLAAARAIRMEREEEHALSTPPWRKAREEVRASDAAAAAKGGKWAGKVPFIPKHYLDAPHGHPRRPSTKAPGAGSALGAAHAGVASQQLRAAPAAGPAAGAKAPAAAPAVGAPGAKGGLLDLSHVRVPQAGNINLFGRSQAIKRAQRVARNGGSRNEDRLEAGGKSSLPSVPSQITNNIVQRLLRMAHDGKLKVAAEDWHDVKHPISDALARHQLENDRLEAMVPRKKSAHEDMHVAAQRAIATDRSAGEAGEAASSQVRQLEDAAEPRAPSVQAASPQRAAEGAREALPRPAVQERPAFSRRRGPPVRARLGAGGEQQRPHVRRDDVLPPSRLAQGAGGGLLGWISAPFKALFGDSHSHQVVVPT